jgi:fatty acid desaturase
MANRRIDWYRTRLEPARLRELTERRDSPGLAQCLSFVLILMVLGSLCFWLWTLKLWILLVPACWLYSTFLFLASMAAGVHELSHGTAFKSKWLNEAFYNLFCFLTWNNPVHFRASHAYHHQDTLHRGIDLEVSQIPVAEKLNARNLFLWFTFDAPWCWLLVRTAFRHAFADDRADYFGWKPLFDRDDPRRKAMFRWARLMILGHLILTAVFAFFQLWILIYLVSLGSFFASWLGKFYGSLQHSGLSESVPDWRLSCHTVEFGPVNRFLYWNMNYHIEHHMYAAVPFHNLPKLHALVAPDYPLPQKGLVAGLRKLYEIRRAQMKDPSYAYVPPFPETATPPRFREGS